MSITIPFYEEIDTERLHLRRLIESDWSDINRYISDPEIMEFEQLLTEEESQKWIGVHTKCNNFWTICLVNTDQIIGNVYVDKTGQADWEIGYILSPDYQQQGYATEAVTALICRTFQIEKAHRICAFCNADNVASWKLLERLGLRREGHIKHNVSFQNDENGNPIWQDTLIYGILKEEWTQKHYPCIVC